MPVSISDNQVVSHLPSPRSGCRLTVQAHPRTLIVHAPGPSCPRMQTVPILSKMIVFCPRDSFLHGYVKNPDYVFPPIGK